MPYIPPEVVARAREMDLLTYLRTYEPQELVHFGGSTYCTREHDSLKISNGKWCWFSRGIGGYSALDYLIKVKEMPFISTAALSRSSQAVSMGCNGSKIVDNGRMAALNRPPVKSSSLIGTTKAAPARRMGSPIMSASWRNAKTALSTP